MSRFKYRAGNEEDRQAAMELAGGDLDGADFRRAKRELNKQRRRNRRAERKARRKGGDAEDYGFEAFTEQEQDAADYFKDLKRGRNKRIAIAAGAVAATALTAGLATGAIGAGGAAAGGTGAVEGAKLGAKLLSAGKKAKKVIDTVKPVVDAGRMVAQSLQPQTIEPPQVDPTDYSQIQFTPQTYQQYGMNMGFGNSQLPNPAGPNLQQGAANTQNYFNQSFYSPYSINN